MAAGPGMLIRKNDRIVFLGDSITEQQLYTNYVETYLASRFPKLKLTFFNAGWGGDTAPGGAARLDRDVLSLRPTMVTLCYGMNDGRYGPPTDEIRTTYVAGMEQLVARLGKAGVRVVLLTPGAVDMSVNPNLAACDYNNKGLRILAAEVLNLAAREKLPCYDLHKLMTEVDSAAKRADPAFCMVPDSVHPDPAGHLVMAYGLLQALGVPPRREELCIDAVSGAASATGGVKADRLGTNDYGLLFDVSLRSLPFFVEPAARKVLPFLPFQESYNTLTLKVRGLGGTHCYFRSPTRRSTALTREQLEHGVNLCDQWSTRVMQQAETVHRFTLEKDQIFFKIWRMLALNGANSAYYHANAHAVGIRSMPAFDRARDALFAKPALTFTLNLVCSDRPGEALTNGDFISQWSFRGIFPKPWDTDYLGGEAAFSVTEPILSKAWLTADVDLANPGNGLCAVFGQQIDCSAYAVTVIESPADQDAALLIGSDDGFALWLNGHALAARLDLARGLAVDSDRVPVTLRKGRNVLLLKVSQGLGGWGFCARFRGLAQPVAARRPGEK